MTKSRKGKSNREELDENLEKVAEMAAGFLMDNGLDQSNTVDGSPIVYIYGKDGVTVQDLDLTGPANTMNLGKVVVINSRNISLKNLDIANFHGEEGKSGTVDGQDGTSGRLGAGIYIASSNGVKVTECHITSIRGGEGGSGLHNYITPGGNGGEGGPGAGVYLDGGTGHTVSGNTISGVRGGTGGYPGDGAVGGNGGRGGIGAGCT